MLLIDEVDKTDVEVEGLLLEVLSDFQVTIPELGTVDRRTPPVRRAHLQRHPRAVRGGQAPLPLPAPRLPRRRAGARRSSPRRCPTSTTGSRAQLVDVVARLRELELKKAPSIAESVDWARTLIALEIGDLDEKAVARTLGVVLKHASDHDAGGQGAEVLADDRSGCSTATSASSRRCARRACRCRWPRASTRSRRCGCCRGTSARPCATAYAATLVKKQTQRVDLRRALRPLLPAAGRRGRRPATDRRARRRDGVRDNARR